jgi:hypothetical protein
LLPFSCSSVWSAPTSARWVNSVLNAVLCPRVGSGIHFLPCFGRLACHPTPTLSLHAFPDPYWVLVAPLGDWLVAHSSSQPLLLYRHLFTESLVLRVWLLAHPSSLGQVQRSTPPPLLVLDYSFLVLFFSFVVGGRVQSAQGLHWIISQEVGRGVVHGA